MALNKRGFAPAENEPVYVIGHNDVDGFGAHALLERKLAGRKVVHHFLDYSSLEETFSKIEHLRDSEIYFVDLNVTSRTGYVHEKLAKLHGNGNRMEWNDHHDWSKKNFEMFSEVVDELTLEKGMCTTEIIRKKYLPKNDGFAARLAAAAHESDFGEKRDIMAHRLAMYLQDVISYADMLDREIGSDREKSELASKLARGVLQDEKLETFYWKYQPIKEKAIAKIDGTMRHYTVNGYDAVFAVVPDELARKSGIARIADKNESADMVVGVNPSGRIMVRISERVPEKCLLRMVAPFDGGGRGGTGGGQFEYGETIGDSNYREAFGIIAKKMESALAGCARTGGA